MDKTDDAPYDAYVWPMFMEQNGGPALIAQAWRQFQNVTTEAGTDTVLNAVLNFELNFRRFAVRNLNLSLMPGDPLPTSQRYVGLDNAFPDGPPAPEFTKYLTLSANQDTKLSLDRRLSPLAAGYFQINVPNDPKIKQVVFDLSQLSLDGLDVDALVKKNGTWEPVPRDLNKQSELRFCIDRPTEKLERIWFVFSNHQFQAGRTIPVDFKVKTLEAPCKSRLRGNSSGTLNGGLLGRYEYDVQTSQPGARSRCCLLLRCTHTESLDCTSQLLSPGAKRYPGVGTL